MVAHIPSLSKVLSNTADAFQTWLHRAGEWLVPQDCFVCGSPRCGAAVCARCEAVLPRLTSAECCPVCAQGTTNGEICGQCQSEMPAFDAVRAAFAYAFPVDRLVQALKYRHRLSLATYFAQALQAVNDHCVADVLLPMPLHVHRLRQRGFNQAVEIARPLAKAWQLPLELTGAIRHKAVPPQEGLSRSERKSNVQGIFSCRRSFNGQSVLIIDDVLTTGATLDALAQVLKQHGAKRVEALVVARTQSTH